MSKRAVRYALEVVAVGHRQASRVEATSTHVPNLVWREVGTVVAVATPGPTSNTGPGGVDVARLVWARQLDEVATPVPGPTMVCIAARS
jgi:hypothetical protein